ncbi:LacI family DNA-binding transcriptional regulator [Rubellimicrobium roseum]|uniref:LacI family transcriptional regulator n=1 Tax=Rubellimicrobium roseum TaxID=687525 RepID=A0A5C4N7H6_9RHOB|nr:LacI family DNA-binding transcriptional regulator [Rubellimicrobium roseum]TNC68246.1 LacI family transcriptional regulator [Rubellimicrobium roseum]
MGRATISDVARRAQVSTATVDRALNGRAGVSAANRQRVFEAARDLGYLPSEGMVPLPTRPAHLEFYLPAGSNSFMRSLASRIAGFAASLPLVASCRIVTMDGIGPDALARALDRIGPRTSGVGLVTTDHPRTRAMIHQLTEGGVRVVTIASDLPGTSRSAYVGVDNHAAGRTAALLMGLTAGPAERSVALFLGSRAFHGHQERERGFRALVRERFPNLRLLPAFETGEDNARSHPAMARLLRQVPDLGGVYCIGAGRSGIVEALRGVPGAARPFVIMHDLTEITRAWLAADQVDVIVDQNARLVGEQSVIRLLGSIATTAPFLADKDIEPRIVLKENLPR